MIAGGIRRRNRSRLDELNRRFTKPFSVREAAEALRLSTNATQKTLAHLASRGWLTRIQHGLYSKVPLGATSPHDWREDPWI
ncbi:MAG: type IV toxin-antitoxin system AbiEi family antitoxin domain-containing protein, partial [Chthoniobacterales bacterium]